MILKPRYPHSPIPSWHQNSLALCEDICGYGAPDGTIGPTAWTHWLSPQSSPLTPSFLECQYRSHCAIHRKDRERSTIVSHNWRMTNVTKTWLPMRMAHVYLKHSVRLKKISHENWLRKHYPLVYFCCSRFMKFMAQTIWTVASHFSNTLTFLFCFKRPSWM